MGTSGGMGGVSQGMIRLLWAPKLYNYRTEHILFNLAFIGLLLVIWLEKVVQDFLLVEQPKLESTQVLALLCQSLGWKIILYSKPSPLAIELVWQNPRYCGIR